MKFIAMNRFLVPKENGAAFEELWLNRDSHLNEMAGFVEFHLLRGPEKDGNILYSSHTYGRRKPISKPGQSRTLSGPRMRGRAACASSMTGIHSSKASKWCRPWPRRARRRNEPRWRGGQPAHPRGVAREYLRVVAGIEENSASTILDERSIAPVFL